MIKLGVIGAGGMGGHHAGRLAEIDQAELVGIADIERAKAETLAAKHQVASYTDYHDLLDIVDTVFICTPPFARTDIVVDAAQAGKHIFAEKPIALTLDEADRMLEATDKAGVKLMIGYVLHFVPTFKTLHDSFASGELGSLISCWTRRYMPWNPAGRWYADQEKSGGITVDFFTHDLDWLRWVGGDVQAVYGKTAHINPDITAEDNVWTMLTFKEGVGVSGASWCASLSDNSIGVVGTKGSIIVDLVGKIRKKLAGGEEEEVTPTECETIQAHFVRCVEQDLEPEITGYDGRAALEIARAIQESSRTGRVIEIKQNYN